MKIKPIHLEAIQLLAYTDKSVAEVAEEIGVGRSTLYTWLRKDEFKKLYHDELENKLEVVRNNFKRDSEKVYHKLLDVVLDPETENRDVITASKFMLEMPLGKAVSKVEMEANQNINQKINIEDGDILDLFEER